MMSSAYPKILIVDDEMDITASLRSFLGRRGFLVRTTASGKEALEMIRTSRPDLILLDLALKEFSGQEVLGSLRQFDKTIKVVIITGHVLRSEKDRREILSLGADAYINKPIKLKVLEKTVYSLLGRGDSPASVECNDPVARTGGSHISAAHKLSNLLGIIRNKCENFTLGVEENIYKDKTDKELVQMSADIMREVIGTVDRAMDVVDQM